ncbi:ATP-binding mismatch repair protein [Paramecium bursaria]
MVFLRSGQTAKNGPEKKYQNPEDVFRKETREEFKKKFPNLETAREGQKKAWQALSEKQKEKYAKLYEASVQEYQDGLVIHYGGTKKDIAAAQAINKIPNRPKVPMNAFFRYLDDHRENYLKEHPDSQIGDVVRVLAVQYNELPEKQKRPYELQTKKEFDAYHIELEKWEKEHEKEFKEGQKVLKDQHRYHSQGQKKEFQYQEILSHKQRRKLVPLGEEATRQIDGRGRPKKVQPQEEQNGRKSMSRGGLASRSPSSNPKIQKEGEQKAAGRGRGRQKKAE